MKKFYILSALLLAMATMPVRAQSTGSLSNIDSQWGKLLVSSGTKTTTMGGQLVKGASGSLYMLAAAGTKTSSDVVSLGDTPIAHGTQNASTSYNQNFILSKINASDGTPVWTVASATGEIATGQQWAAATSDGGVIAAFCLRHTYGGLTDNIALVDATGDTTTVDWALEAGATNRYYRIAVMKVTADGTISWIKQIAVNHDPQPGATSDTYKKITPTGAYLYGMTVDSNDNIYLSGRVCTALTLTKADGQNLYAMTRCKGSNLTSKAPATSAKAPFVVNATEYSCLISAYTLPFAASTAVKNVNAEKTATSVRYYNLQGIESATPQAGINIKVTTYSDGSREAVKEIK